MNYLKILLFLGCISFASLQAGAQAYDYPEPENAQEVYIPNGFVGTGTGLNNINGMLGVTVEALVFRNTTLIGAAGIGAWGYKFTLDARYYLNYPKGVFFGMGYSMATGVEDIPLDLETTTSDDPVSVTVDLNQAQTLNITSGIQWRFGKRFRMGLLYGYALPLQERAWEVESPGVELSENGEAVLDIMTPGGIIIGFGVSFGIY